MILNSLNLQFLEQFNMRTTIHAKKLHSAKIIAKKIFGLRSLNQIEVEKDPRFKMEFLCDWQQGDKPRSLWINLDY